MFKKHSILISCTLIITLGFVVYANSLSGKFIWDDNNLIKYNTYIKNWSKFPALLGTNIAAGAGKKYSLYRPLQMITYILDYSFWRFDVRGYHLTNILLHILVGLSIYRLINILFTDNLLAALCSILFVVHPIHTEAVAYISGRSDPLALLFLLLCFIFYIKYYHTERISFYILMLLTYILALLSRETSLILPLLLLLYHYYFKKKVKSNAFLSILGIVFVYILLRITVFRDLLAGYNTTLLQRIPGFFVAITNYLRILFLPVDLHMEYGNKLFYFSQPQAMLGIFILLSLMFVIFSKRNSNKLLSFSLSWFLISLLPISNLYPLNAYMAEHWLYIPSIGFFLILAKLICYIFRDKNFKLLAGVFAVLLVFFHSYLTIKQNSYWQEPIIFYERTLVYNPESPRIYNNLANEYNLIGKYEKAIALYEKAIELSPAYVDAYNNFAATYRDLGKQEKTIAFFEKAIAINPRYMQTYINLAITYLRIGKYEKAIPLYEKAIELNPSSAQTYNNLAVAYNYLGKYEKAIALYEKAIELNPSSAKIYNNLANTYRHQGKYEKAIALYEKAIELNPNYVNAYYNLALYFFCQKQYKLAAKYYGRAKQLGLDNHHLLEIPKLQRKD
jgi:tetratricopeptide (TPR) repeat protein